MIKTNYTKGTPRLNETATAGTQKDNNKMLVLFLNKRIQKQNVIFKLDDLNAVAL